MLNSNPYNCFTDEDESGSFSYLFLTDNNVVYTVYFNLNEYDRYLDNFPMLLQNSYGFGFFPSTNEFKGIDIRVFETIQHIMLDFFASHDTDLVLLYHCQTTDDNTGQRKREQAFQRRYDRSTHKEGIIKKSIGIEISINDAIVPHYIGLFTKASNPQLESVYAEMEEFAVRIAEEKMEK